MGRKSKKLQARNKFYILTNGKETENNYFNLIKSKKSIYDVKIEYHNSDPLGLVEYAAKLTDANQKWCVFDIDDTFKCGTLSSAIKLAKDNNIQLAFSNMAFEVWLLSHYITIENHKNNNELICMMNKILEKELKLNKYYDKSDKELLKKYFIPKLTTAVTNTKKVYQKYVAEHKKANHTDENYKIWEWNSCSNVYQLIEALKLNNYK